MFYLILLVNDALIASILTTDLLCRMFKGLAHESHISIKDTLWPAIQTASQDPTRASHQKWCDSNFSMASPPSVFNKFSCGYACFLYSVMGTLYHGGTEGAIPNEDPWVINPPAPASFLLFFLFFHSHRSRTLCQPRSWRRNLMQHGLIGPMISLGMFALAPKDPAFLWEAGKPCSKASQINLSGRFKCRNLVPQHSRW